MIFNIGILKDKTSGYLGPCLGLVTIRGQRPDLWMTAMIHSCPRDIELRRWLIARPAELGSTSINGFAHPQIMRNAWRVRGLVTPGTNWRAPQHRRS